MVIIVSNKRNSAKPFSSKKHEILGVIGRRTNRGAGKIEKEVIYVLAEDTEDALKVYNQTQGVKKTEFIKKREIENQLWFTQYLLQI